MQEKYQQGDLTLSLSGDVVASRVDSLVSSTRKSMEQKNFHTLVLDLTEVEHIDSKGITYVVGLYKSLKREDKVLKVVGLSDNLYNLFDLMNLNRLFTTELVG